MKAWLAIGLLIAIFQAVPKQADKPHANQHGSKNLSEQPKQPARGATPNVPLPGPSTAPKEDGSKRETKQPGWCEKLISPVVLNWPLIAVAIWGILVARSTLHAIKWQAGETAKATEAMRKSVTLQEIQSRQWLEIQDVEVDSPIIPHGVAETELTLSFQVINPTKMAVTLKDIEITLFEDDRFYYRPLEYTLIPDGNYPVSIKIHLVEHAFGAYVKAYEKGLYVIPVTGLIKFEDAFEKTRQQSFGFDCRRSQGKWEFTIPKKVFPRCTKGDDEKQEDKEAN